MRTSTAGMAIMTAIGAGLASALLYASLLGGTMLAVPLFLLTPLPLVIVSLGWGTLAGIGAAAVGALAIGVTLSTIVSGAFLLSSAVPALLPVYLIGLARPVDPAHPDGVKEWYPLGRVLVATGLTVAVVSVIGGYLLGYDADATTRDLVAYMVSAGRPEAGGPTAAEVEPYVRLMVRLLPVFFPAVWTAGVVFNLWLGARVVRQSERLVRPWEDLARIDVPRGAGLILLAAVALGFAPSPVGPMAGPFEGALATVFMFVGLAVLHFVTRGSDARPLILSVIYGVLFLFTFPAVVLAIIGLSERTMRFRDRKGGSGPPARL